MKKLINAADDVVGEALDGLTLVNAGIARLTGSTTAIRSDVEAVRAAGQVAPLSGGGAGHEPAHTGYVGAGMLTGAVAGEVFTSPSVDAILDAIRAVASPGGVLLIVKNYTGDRLNFGLAEIEWGLGIHGEPGVERAGLRPAYEVVDRLVSAIVDDRGIGAGQRVAVLVNGLGATPPMELSIVADAAARDLRRRDIQVERIWAGNFLTALDMAGCSLSVLPVDDEVLNALDASTTAPAWPRTVTAAEPASIAAPAGEPAEKGTLPAEDPIRRALESVAEALISVRDELTELDRGRGLRDPMPSGHLPTFGVYLLGEPPPDFGWESRWVRWPDFRLPDDPAYLRSVLLEVLDRAADGRTELACGGGCGRTGTALACLAILDGVPAPDAVGYVRAHYDQRAVETPWQRRFARRFRSASR